VSITVWKCGDRYWYILRTFLMTNYQYWTTRSLLYRWEKCPFKS